MATDANFTHKELCLLMSTICEKEFGIIVDKSIADVRKKVDLFKNDNTIHIEKVSNKQGKTRVSAFRTTYCDDLGMVGKAYTITL